jgi:hypothetical protein
MIASVTSRPASFRMRFNVLLSTKCDIWWYMVEYFFISSVTNGIWRSLCSVRFETYHGTLVMERSTFDGNRWSTFVFDGLVHPQSWIPYVQIGFRIHLYTRIFFFAVKVWILVLGAKIFVVILSLNKLERLLTMVHDVQDWSVYGLYPSSGFFYRTRCFGDRASLRNVVVYRRYRTMDSP